MPSYVGAVFIQKNTSVITVGDGNKLTPKIVLASYAGSGRFDIGELQTIVNTRSKTQVIDNDIIDQGFILDL